MKEDVMMSATGEIFIIERFGFSWTFQGLQFGFWKSKKKMIKFYREVFGFQYLGRL